MAVERPDWDWYQRASDLASAGDFDGAERAAADALEAGHLLRASLLLSPRFDPMRGRPGFERTAAEAWRRVAARGHKPLILTAAPSVRSGVAPLVVVLHGARGNAAMELDRWSPATDLGFIVAAAQSSQPATEDGFCWDPPRERIWEDVRAIAAMLPPHGRVVMAGFSQGSWVALLVALQANVIVAGTVLMFGPFVGDLDSLPAPWRRLRISIIAGENDPYREGVTRLGEKLEASGHHTTVEVIPNLGHEYPPDFAERLPALLRP